MLYSFYDSPHGLMNKNNWSTAEDQTILISECMKNETFRKVVGTKSYETLAHGGTRLEGLTQYRWENSNKLLGKMEGLLGCKTGITDAAGPCFGGYYEQIKKDGTIGMKLAIVLCHAETLDHRWVEIRSLVDWTKENKKEIIK